MPSFQYTALDASGQRVAGVLAGTNEQAVLSELESRRLTPVAISPERESLGIRRGVSTRALAHTYLQLSDLLRAGVPLMRGLRLLGNRRANPRLSAAFREIGEAVSQGRSLADAMSERPAIFPRVHVAMVRAGEAGGFLEQVLARLGQFVMSQAEMRGKVLGNMIYPAVLLGAGVVVVTLIFGKFVPMMAPLFERVKDKMPFVSKVVFSVGEAVSSYAVVGVVVVAVGVGLAWRLKKIPAVQRKVTEVRTRMPVIGPLTRAIGAARFCRMMGTMLANGIPVLTAMQIAKEAAGNVLMEEAIDKAAESVRAGQPLAAPLGESRLFDEDVVEMVSVAESANNLDAVLVTIADTLEGRVDRLLTAAVKLVEPLLILILATTLGILAIGLILPMMQLTQAI